METFVEIKLSITYVHEIHCKKLSYQVFDYVTMKKHLRTKGPHVYVNIKGQIYIEE
jgi:hypothetical protein